MSYCDLPAREKRTDPIIQAEKKLGCRSSITSQEHATTRRSKLQSGAFQARCNSPDEIGIGTSRKCFEWKDARATMGIVRISGVLNMWCQMDDGLKRGGALT